MRAARDDLGIVSFVLVHWGPYSTNPKEFLLAVPPLKLGQDGHSFWKFQGAGRARAIVSLLPVFLQSAQGDTWRNTRGRQLQTDLHRFSHGHLNVLISFTILQMDIPARSFLNLWCHTEIDLPIVSELPVTANSNLRRSFSGSTATRIGLAWAFLPQMLCSAFDGCVSTVSTHVWWFMFMAVPCERWDLLSQEISSFHTIYILTEERSGRRSWKGSDSSWVRLIPRIVKVEETCCQSKGDLENSFPFLICHLFLQYTY